MGPQEYSSTAAAGRTGLRDAQISWPRELFEDEETKVIEVSDCVGLGPESDTSRRECPIAEIEDRLLIVKHLDAASTADHA